MNLFYLRYFVKLAHVGHYTKAAEQLCITQPSLSHAISQLEKELGLPLFEKYGRKTTLTRYGEEFLLCAEQTLRTLDNGLASLERAANGEGEIRLGILRTLGIQFIPRLAARFLEEHPEAEIHFSFHTGITRELLSGLLAQKYDLAFCSEPPEELELTSVPVGGQELVLITPKDHPLAALSQVDLSQTLPYPQVYFSPGSGMRDVVNRLFEQTGRRPLIACETEEDEVIAGLVAQGFGIAVVPYMDLLEKLELAVIPLHTPGFERKFFMVHDGRRFMPPAVRHFRDFVLECV